MQLLDKAIILLVNDGKLPKNYKPHKLKGEYTGLWERHIQPDWLLIWDYNDVQGVIVIRSNDLANKVVIPDLIRDLDL